MEVNPVRLLDLPHADQTLPDVLSRESMNKLIGSVQPGDRFAAQDVAMLELFYASGLRVSELIGLKLDDWHPLMGMLKVHGKGRKTALCPCIRSLRWQEQHRRTTARAGGRGVDTGKQPTTTIFLSRAGIPLTRVALWQIVRKASAKAGLRPVHPPYAAARSRHLLSGRADLRVIQEI